MSHNLPAGYNWENILKELDPAHAYKMINWDRFGDAINILRLEQIKMSKNKPCLKTLKKRTRAKL